LTNQKIGKTMSENHINKILELVKDVWLLFPNKSLTEVISLALDFPVDFATDELLEEKLKEVYFQNM
jgi:hypothetical protein